MAWIISVCYREINFLNKIIFIVFYILMLEIQTPSMEFILKYDLHLFTLLILRWHI